MVEFGLLKLEIVERDEDDTKTDLERKSAKAESWADSQFRKSSD